MKGKISQQTHACPRALCALRAQGSGSGALRMKLGWYSQSSGLGNHPIHTGMHMHAHTHIHSHTHTHTHTHITFWSRVLILIIVSTHEESQEQWKLQKQHLICRCFFLSEKLVFDFCSKQTYHTTPLLWLPSLTNEPSLYSLSEEKKTKTICSFPNPHTTYPNASFSSSSDSLLWLPSSLLGSSLLTSFHNVHLPQSNCYGPSLMWYWKVNVPVRTFSTMK